MIRQAVKAGLNSLLLKWPYSLQSAVEHGYMASLCYHRILDTANDPLNLCTGVNEFEQQLKILTNTPGIRAVSATEFAQIYRGELPYGNEVPVLVSFDDGYKDNLMAAAPLLERYQVPAILFVASDSVFGDGLWYDRLLLATSADITKLWAAYQAQGLFDENATESTVPSAITLIHSINGLSSPDHSSALELLRQMLPPVKESGRYLSAADLAQWHARGFEVGGHTAGHPRMSSIPLTVARNEVSNNLNDLADILPGVEIKYFAYPFGTATDFTSAHQRLLAETGIELAFTTTAGVDQQYGNPYTIKRKCVNSKLFELGNIEVQSALFLGDLLGTTKARPVPWRAAS